MHFRKIFLLLLIPVIFSFGQDKFGNEWINFGQQYWKITVSEDGVYELPLDELSSEAITPENLQLFYLGKEMAIQVKDNSILFYGESNKGDLDSLVYKPSDARMNPFQSLFSDESSYFLTIVESAGKRMSIAPYNDLPQADFHIKKEVVSYEQQYSFNNSIGLLPNLQQSYYENGEGWSGVFMSADSSSSFSIPLNGFYAAAEFQSTLKFKLNGRSRTAHKILYAINGEVQADTLNFDGFEELEREVSVNGINTAIKIDFYPIVQDGFDWYSVTYFELSYPQGISFIEDKIETMEGFNYPFKTGVINISDRWNPTFYESKDASFSSAANSENFYFNSFKAIPKVEVITFGEIIPSDYNYVMLTSESLLDGATAYSDYRSSVAGGNYKTLVLTMGQVYDQFTFGLRNPLAVRRMADLLLQNTTESKFLFLLGRAVTFPDVMKSNSALDLVPSFGYPGSDVLLTAGAGGELSDVAGMPTGRLNVTNNSQILAYLDKVKETEAAPKGQAWKKRFLHLSGGKESFEINSLARVLENIVPQAKDNFWGADIDSFRKQSLEEVENIDISKAVNDGVGLITFAGHGSANVIDLNIGYCSDVSRNFDNKGKYPLMFFNGCGVGNVFYRYDPLTTDWLLTPNKGAIAVFANSFWSYLLPTQLYLNRLYEKLFVDSETIGLTLGEIQQEVNRDLEVLKGNDYILANMHQMILQGDPAIKMFAMEAPDLVAVEDGMTLQSVDVSKPMIENDSLLWTLPVQNLGKYDSTQRFTALIRGYNGYTFVPDIPSFPFNDTLRLKFKLPSIINNMLMLTLNVDKGIEELNYTNNYALFRFENQREALSHTSYPANLVPDKVAPLLLVKVNNKQIENGDYVAASSNLEVKLIDENSLENSQIDLLSLTLTNSSGEEMDIEVNSANFDNGNEFIANVLLNLEPGTYQLMVAGQDRFGNQAATSVVSFTVAAEEAESTIRTYPNLVVNGNEVYVVYSIVAPSSPAEGILGVYNSQGRLVYANKVVPTVGKNTVTLALDSFSGGVYTVKLELAWPENQEVLTTRFVVP